LTTRGSDIAGKLDQLRETLTKEDNELRTQAPALDRLKGVGAKLDEANDKLSKVEAKENELANSVTRARTQADLTASHAEAARQAAELAAQARTKAVSDLQSIGNGTADQERALGAIISRIENLKKQIEASETQLRNGLPVALDSTALTQAMSPLSARVAKLEDRLNHQPSAPTPPDITGLTARLSKLEERLDRVVPPQGTLDLGPLTARVAKLEDRLDHLTPAPQAPAVPALPTSEGKLNLSQKMLIQWALAYRGFNPGEIDGNFGRIGSNSRTRGAIERLREALRSRARGELTHDEITELLTPAQ
jgi:DNA repair exonuclease SbcCD ATPase subunit